MVRTVPNIVRKRKRRPSLLCYEDVIGLLRAEVEAAGGQSAWARQTGANRTSLNLTLSGRQGLTHGVLDALGLERVVAYTRK